MKALFHFIMTFKHPHDIHFIPFHLLLEMQKKKKKKNQKKKKFVQYKLKKIQKQINI